MLCLPCWVIAEQEPHILTLSPEMESHRCQARNQYAAPPIISIAIMMSIILS